MKKIRSVKKITIRYFTLMMIAAILCLFLSSAYSIWVYQRQLRYCNEATQDVARNNLSHTLDELSEYNRMTSSVDVDYMLLSYESEQIAPHQKLESMLHMRRSISNRTPSAGGMLLFNRTGSIFYYRFGRQFNNGLMTVPEMEYMHLLSDYLLTRTDQELNGWQVYSGGGSVLLVNAYRQRDLYICAFLDLNAFAQYYIADSENIHYALYSNDSVLTNADYVEDLGLTLADLVPPSESYSMRHPFQIIETEYYSEYGIGLASVISLSGVWAYSWVYLLVVSSLLACIVLVFASIRSMIRRVLFYPLDEISIASSRLANSEQMPPADDTDLEELVAIRTALEHLVEQKVRLTRENEDRIQEKNHAMLQYYQLQTRSHFFLNCLKSIYSMTEKGQTEKTKRMILCFSNHLRYIFHDTLSLVTLESELAEVGDYYQIIQLDRQTPVLLDVEVPDELMCCRVPPLTIQTFVENSYKYNNDGSKLLRFRIQADRIVLDGKTYLRLRLSDNGKGYSQEVLDSLEDIGEVFETHHVGIKNLRRRIGILFDGDYQIAFRNGHDGGAVTVIYLPIEKGEKP